MSAETPGVEGRVPAAGSEGISDGFGAGPAAGSQSASVRSPVTEVTGAGVAPAVEARSAGNGAGPAETLRKRLQHAFAVVLHDFVCPYRDCDATTILGTWGQEAAKSADRALAVFAAWLLSDEVYGQLTTTMRRRLPAGLDTGYITSQAQTILHDLLVDSAIGSATPDSPAVARVSSVAGPSSPAAGDP